MKTVKKQTINDKLVKGKYMFLTIPHFDKLDEVYNILETSKKEHSLDLFAVVLETHTEDVNKGKHLHVLVKFTKRRELCLTYFDFLGKHGNLQSVRSVDAVLQYMNKENISKANFDVWEQLLEKNFTRTVIRMQVAGWNQDDILLSYGTKMSGSKPWRSAFDIASRYCLAKADKEIRTELTRMRQITSELISKRLNPDELATFTANPHFQIFVDYVNNLLKYGNMHPYKACCLAIVGKPSIGKSTVLRALKKHFITYNFPLDGWHTQYINYVTELIVWNEWDIKLLSRSDLLLLTEGEIVDLRVKYTKAIKKDRPLIALTANDTWATQVRKRYHYDPQQRNTILEALAVRIVELDFDRQPIWFLTKLFVSTLEDI